MPFPEPSPVPDDRREPSSRIPWRRAALGLSALGAPFGIGVTEPLFGQIDAAIELAVALVVVGTALFGSPVLSERGFRLLRWIASRPEPRTFGRIPGSTSHRPEWIPSRHERDAHTAHCSSAASSPIADTACRESGT